MANTGSMQCNLLSPLCFHSITYPGGLTGALGLNQGEIEGEIDAITQRYKADPLVTHAHHTFRALQQVPAFPSHVPFDLLFLQTMFPSNDIEILPRSFREKNESVHAMQDR